LQDVLITIAIVFIWKLFEYVAARFTGVGLRISASNTANAVPQRHPMQQRNKRYRFRHAASSKTVYSAKNNIPEWRRVFSSHAEDFSGNKHNL